jgi:hypothetical protein
MRCHFRIHLLALLLGSCAATPPELLTRPGDQCRVYWQAKNSAAPTIELVNRSLYDADEAAQLRCQRGSAKVMPDAEMALLIEELADLDFFRSSVSDTVEPGSRTAISIEINGSRRSLAPTGSGATDMQTAAADYGACGRLLQDAYNATLGAQQGEIKGMTGEEYFRREQERLEREAEERIQKVRRSEGGR